MTETKSCMKTFRITPKMQEHLIRRKKECGLSEGAYLRQLLLQDMGTHISMETKEERMWRKQLLLEINRIGTNINQIAKNNNSKFYSFQDKKNLLLYMKIICKLLADNFHQEN